LHDGVRVRDSAGGKWKASSDADMLIVHVVPPKVEAEPVAADAAAAADGPGRARSHQEGQDREADEEKD
jgi:hypothetical protein